MLQSPAKDRYRSADKAELTKEGWKLLKDEQAKTAWEDALKKEPQFQTDTMHMITGAILPIWNRLPQGQSRVIRVQSDDGKIYLGRLIRDRDINSTLKNLGATVNTNFTPSEIQDKILNKNNEVALANGWKIAKRRVSGEQRIEILGDDLWKFDPQFKSNGIIQERIQYNSRYFLPSGDNFNKSFQWLVKDRPIVDVIAPDTQNKNNSSTAKANSTRYNIKELINDGNIKPVTAENIQKAFPNSTIIQDGKTFTVKLPNSREITVNTEWDIKIKDIKGAAEAYKDIFPDGIPDNAMASGRFEGGGLQGIIDLASFADQDAINHESFHAAFWMALSENEQNAIYRKFGKDVVGEENAAFAFEEWRAKKNETGTKEKGNILGRLFQKIMDFSTRIRDEVFRDHKAIFRSIEDGSIWENHPSPDSLLSGSGRGTEKVPVHSQREGLTEGLTNNEKGLSH